MRNPKWHRDEIILALDLYFQPDRGSIDARNPKIIELSEIINQLPLFEQRPDAERFRNANGVGLKLSNFLAIDPDYPGKGMASYSQLDKEVFHEFAQDHERLHIIARKIKAAITDPVLRQSILTVEADEQTVNDMVHEGQVLYRLHKYRERKPSIVAAKKKAVWKATGKLACEVCAFEFERTYGALGKGFIECHHTSPLAEYDVAAATRLSDLALVCSNCHRMLHREMPLMSVEGLRSLVEGRI